MIRLPLILAALLSLPLLSHAQTKSSTQATQPAADVREFLLTPAAPPVPALKHELIFDVLADRTPGNAAILYLQAALMLGTESPQTAQAALRAYEAKDLRKFNELAEELGRPAIFKQLELAARREECDWQPPLREMGAQALLPHLQPIAHGLTRMTKVRALHEIEQGKAEEAIATLRLGYEMADKVGQEPVLVSAIVSLAITTQMNDALARLMNRPESPSLYWALCELPDRRGIWRNAFYGERRMIVPATPHLADAIAGKDLSPQQWRTLLELIASLHADPGKNAKPDPVEGATPENVRRGRELYAKSRGLEPEQVEKLDPVVVLGNFYVQQAETLSDDIFKLRGLPYPALLRKSQELNARMAKLAEEQPGNPFLPMLDLYATATRFARVDREIDALANVEAVRAYAAANDGKLPPTLGDIADTPTLENPMTREPFEYVVRGDVATLADSRSAVPLSYTIRIRK